MYTELSHYVLILTIFFVFTLKHTVRNRVISILFLILTICLCGTLACYMCSDFSIYNIFTNSNINTPLFYKISATWSNHEGSFLLWCWLLSLYGFVFCYFAEQSTMVLIHRRELDHFMSFLKADITNQVSAPLFLAPVVQPRDAIRTSFRNPKGPKLFPISSGVIPFARTTIEDQQKNQKIRRTSTNLFAEVKALFFSMYRGTSAFAVRPQRIILPFRQKSTTAENPGTRQGTMRWMVLLKNVNVYARRRWVDMATNGRWVMFSKGHNLNSRWSPTLSNTLLDLTAPSLAKNIKQKEWLNTFKNQSAKWTQVEQRIKPFLIYMYIICVFSVFLILTSNPFLKMPFMCLNSVVELNPVLQDPVLAVHPPCIYAGYVASAVGFSLCLSKLWQISTEYRNTILASTPTNQNHLPSFINGAINKVSVTKGKNPRTKSAGLVHFPATTGNDAPPANREPFLMLGDAKKRETLFLTAGLLQSSALEQHTAQIRTWSLIGWCFLTVGILLGSWWAYHELGWGGWWFWDPVENASLMPWLCATAAIHSVIIPRLSIVTLGLNLLTFALSLLGTFFVRSGLLASVHSFAVDSTRGLFLISFVLYVTVISLFLLVKSFRALKSTALEALVSLLLFGPLKTSRSAAHPALKVRSTKQAARRLLASPFLPILRRLLRSPGAKDSCLDQHQAQRGPNRSKERYEASPLGSKHETRTKSAGLQSRYEAGGAEQKLQATIGRPHRAKQNSEAVLASTFRGPEGVPKVGTIQKEVRDEALLLSAFEQRWANIKRANTQTEQILLLQALFLILICAVVLCGTSAPILFQWLFNRDVSTGAPFFNRTIVPLFGGVLAMLVYVHYTQLKFKKVIAPPKNKLADHEKRGVITAQLEQLFVKWIARFLSVPNRLVLRPSQPVSKEKIKILWDFTRGLLGPEGRNSLLRDGPVLLRRTAYRNCSASYLSLERTSLWSKIVSRPERHVVNVKCLLACIWLLCLFHFIGLVWLSDFSLLETSYVVTCMCFFGCLILAPKSKRFQVNHTILHQNTQPIPSRLITFTIYLNKVAFNMKLSHAGLGLFLIGVLLSNTYKIQFTQILRSGSQINLGTQICCLRGIDQNYGPTFHSICGNLVVYQPATSQNSVGGAKHLSFFEGLLKDGYFTLYFRGNKTASDSRFLFSGQGQSKTILKDCFTPNTLFFKEGHASETPLLNKFQRTLCLFPEKRFFFSNSELSTTKVAIHTNLFTDLYCLIGAGSAETGWYTTIMRLPFIFCIWIGFLLAAIGGVYSLSHQVQKVKLKWI